MSWEYLQSDQLDDRMKIVAGYLKGKTKDKALVDLNCLEARLLKYLDHDFSVYIGNDVLDKFPSCPNTVFNLQKDDEFVKTLVRCDILMLFGHGGYEITGEKLESPTITESVKYVIETHKPEIVILESIQDFEGIICDIVKDGYKLEVQAHLNLGEEWVEKRCIYIYRRDYADTN